jgi:tripartite ATP-independent transporter DctM subunit
MSTALMTLALFTLLIVGAPIGVALGLSGVIGLYSLRGMTDVAGILEQAPLSHLSRYELLTIPMFMLMGEFVVQSRIAERLFDAAVVWLGRVPGGLAIATALFGAGFGAISGSSVAGAATLASTSSPAMMTRGYEPRFANGVVAISGTLAMLIPPSIALILYALLTDLNTSKMLVAGLIPAVFIILVIVVTIWFLLWRKPSRAPQGRAYTWREKLAATNKVGPVVLLIVAVSASLYFGIATPVETSALGALAAFLIALSSGTMNRKVFVESVTKAARTSTMIGFILVGAAILGYAMTLTQTTQSIVHGIAGLHVNRYVIVALILLLKLVLGCFLDQSAILVLTVPIMVPVIMALGFDPIWFGVMVVVTAEVGMITPPIGLNVYIISRYTGRPAEEIFAGTWPHVVAHVVAIAILVAFPQIATFLPSRM